MDISTKSKTVIETNAHFHNTLLKTHPCALYEWYGEDRCEKIDLNNIVENIKLPEGEYKITITLEKVN